MEKIKKVYKLISENVYSDEEGNDILSIEDVHEIIATLTIWENAYHSTPEERCLLKFKNGLIKIGHYNPLENAYFIDTEDDSEHGKIPINRAENPIIEWKSFD